MSKIKGLFRLIRFELPFAAGVCVVLGQMFGLGGFASLSITAAAFFSVFFISASILVLNDYFDVETDKINSPHRPIPSGLVTKGEALLFSILLIVAGLTTSYLISTMSFAISIALTTVGNLYNRYFKKSGLAGNLMVSFSVGMTFIYGGASVGMPFNKIVLFFAAIAALVDLGEEIAADAMDMEGDKLINSNSIAIKYGREKAIKISSLIFFFIILLTAVPFVLNWFSAVYFIPFAVMDFSIGYSTIKLLKGNNEERRKYIRYVYLGSTLGLIIFLVMRLMNI